MRGIPPLGIYMNIVNVLIQLPIQMMYFFKKLFDNLLASNYTGGNGIHYVMVFIGSWIAVMIVVFIIGLIKDPFRKRRFK